MSLHFALQICVAADAGTACILNYQLYTKREVNEETIVNDLLCTVYSLLDLLAFNVIFVCTFESLG